MSLFYLTSLFPGCTTDIMSLFYFTSLFPGCTVDIMTSGHSPVFATFQIGGVKQYASEAGLRSRVGGRERSEMYLQKQVYMIIYKSSTEYPFSPLSLFLTILVLFCFSFSLPLHLSPFSVFLLDLFSLSTATPAALPNGTNCFIIVDSCKAKVCPLISHVHVQTVFFLNFWGRNLSVVLLPLPLPLTLPLPSSLLSSLPPPPSPSSIHH